MKKPSRLLQDNDGHWYLIPDALITKFEDLLAATEQLESADDFSGSERLYQEMDKFTQYAVNRPSDILIKDWEET